MAAVDINAQREKIQREIEALERSLGPDVASIDVVVSDTSLDDDDDDDDDLTTEDNLDGDLLKFQNDFEWDDGCSKTEMCLQMNLVYQAVIEEKIQEVELLIAQNKEQQDEMLWRIAGHRVQKPADGKSSSLYLYLGHFLKPYFKDKVTGLGPPSNQDMQERTLQGIKPFASLYHRKWKSENKQELRNAVMSDSLQKMLQPKILKLEYLQTKTETASDMNKKIFEKQIKETEREIDDINQLSEEALLGKRSDEHDWEKISNMTFEGLHGAEKLRKIWQNSEHPHVSKSAWEEDEVSKLLEIAAKHNCANWQAIAQELGTNRTAFQCLQKYQFTNKDFKRKEFTKEEDEMLTDLVQQMRVGNHIPYRKISYFMEGRYPMQLLCRWSKTLDPNLKRGSWSPSEDELLLKAVAKYGEKEWYKIQGEVPGRSDVQCRERYMKGLRGDVKKGRWNANEEKKLWELIEKHGVGNWSKLASEFPNRNGAQCLSKWKVLMGIRKQRWLEQKLKKKKPKEVISDTDTFSSGSSTSSDDSEMEFESSEEERKVVPKAAKSNDYGMFNLDLWVPRRQFLEPSNKTRRSRGSGNTCSVVGQKKIKEGSLQFNTVLKGIAYPHSTDTVLESVDEFLKEADESRRDILHIREETVQYILRRNSKLHHGKPVHRAEGKLPNSAEAPDRQTEEVSATQESPQHNRNERNTIDRKLLLAVTPWVGNVFIPLSTSFGRPRKSSTRADLLGEKVCAVTLTSTPLFTFFIQLFQINAEGCLQIIRVRKSQQANLHRRAPSSASKQSGSSQASRDPTSPPSSLVRALNQMSPVAGGLSAPLVRAMGSANARPLRPVQKPKTVCELLREKRMRESIAQAPAQPRVVIPGQPGTIQLNANEMGQGQTARLPLASSPTENRLWPVVPTTPAGLPRLPIPHLQTVVSGARVATPSVPFTWVVTPQGLVPMQIKALNVAGPNPKTPGGVQAPVSSPEVIKTALLPLVKSAVNGRSSSTVKLMLSTGSGDRSSSGLASTAQPCSSKSVSDSNLPAPSALCPPSTTASVATASSQVPGPRPTPASPSGPASNTPNVPSLESRIPPALAATMNPVVQLTRIQSADNAGSAPHVTASAPPTAPQTPPRGSDKSALDLSLVALDDQAEVKEWLKGRGGVDNPSLKTNMAYLPPSSCTLKTLSRLLLQKSALEESAFKLLPPAEGEEPSPSKKVETVNDLVAQKLKDNPAFLSLKQRFLSAFTFPALLATLPPGQVKTTMDVHKEDCKLKEEDMSDFTDSEVNDDQNDDEDVEENSQGTSSKAGLPEAPVLDATGQEEPDEQPAGPAAAVDGPASDRSAVRRTTRKRAHPQKWT